MTYSKNEVISVQKKVLDEQLEYLKSEYQIKGFRKGKVPRILFDHLEKNNVLDNCIWYEICNYFYEIYKTKKIEELKKEKNQIKNKKDKSSDSEKEISPEDSKSEEEHNYDQYFESYNPINIRNMLRKNKWRDVCTYCLGLYNTPGMFEEGKNIFVQRITIENIKEDELNFSVNIKMDLEEQNNTKDDSINKTETLEKEDNNKNDKVLKDNSVNKTKTSRKVK